MHDGARPERLLVFCHGVFGMGTNFRTIARAVVAAIPDLGVVLVDLRGHGATPLLEPPHDLDAAARDVDALAASLPAPVVALAGHSFGGKVVLDLLRLRPGAYPLAVVIDSMPGPRPMDAETESAARVLELLESLPPHFESREWFKSELSSRGLPAAIVEWLSMNVRREGDAYALRLGLQAIRAMLTDYFSRDLWPVVRDPTLTSRLVVVVAGRSTVFDAASRATLLQAAELNPNLSIVDLPNAGHWVHVDDPAGLLALLRAELEPGKG